MLRKIVTDAVEVSLLGREDVHRWFEAGGLLEQAGHHRSHLGTGSFPKERGPADLAKASLGKGARLVPRDVVATFDRKPIVRHLSGGVVQARLLAALRTVAEHNAAQFTMGGDADASAQARAGAEDIGGSVAGHGP